MKINHQLIHSSFFLAAIIFICNAGPNSKARISIDYDALTEQKDTHISKKTGVKFIAVKIKDVKDLDGYSIIVSYDTTLYRYRSVLNTVPETNEKPFLESKGGKSGPLIVKNSPSTIEVSASLIGNNRSEAPDGEGVLAVIEFEQTSAVSGSFYLVNCEIIDSDLNYDLLNSGLKGYSNEK